MVSALIRKIWGFWGEAVTIFTYLYIWIINPRNSVLITLENADHSRSAVVLQRHFEAAAGCRTSSALKDQPNGTFGPRILMGHDGLQRDIMVGYRWI